MSAKSKVGSKILPGGGTKGTKAVDVSKKSYTNFKKES